MGMDSCWSGFGWMGAGMMLQFLLGLGLLSLAIVGMVFAARWLARASGGTPQARDDALEIVRTRYARGEISREDFDRLRRELA
jgi:putative membrane protein